MLVDLDESVDASELWPEQQLRDISSEVRWSVSSCKKDNGVEQLRDSSLDTYWQSDGPQPHLLNMMFTRCTAVAQVSLFLDVQLDESYTPEVVSLRAGNRHHDLREIRRLHLVEPSGWVHIPVNRPNRSVMRVFMLQLAVLKNHQSGKDTHIRQVRVWAHKQDRHL